MRGPSPAAVSGGHSSSRCTGLPLSRPPPLRSTGSRRAGSAVVAHGPSCSAACGILPNQGSNSCPPHWQVDSQPLRHQGSPNGSYLKDNSSNIVLGMLLQLLLILLRQHLLILLRKHLLLFWSNTLNYVLLLRLAL